MGRKHYKTEGYDPITRKRISGRWSEEKLKQVRRDARQFNAENKNENGKVDNQNGYQGRR